MKVLIVILSLLLMVGCNTESIQSDDTSSTSTLPPQPEEVSSTEPTPLDAETTEMLWSQRLYPLYWTALNGKMDGNITITVEDISRQDIFEMIMREIAQGGYDEIEQQLKEGEEHQDLLISFDLLDRVSLKLFNTVYDWNDVENIHFNGELATVTDDAWQINLWYTQYAETYRSDILFNEIVDSNTHGYPKARINNTEYYPDGTVKLYLFEDLYGDFGAGEYMTTMNDVFTFKTAENGNLYLYEIERSFKDADLLSIPEGVQMVENYEEFVGHYVTTIGDNILTSEVIDGVASYHLSDAITGKRVASQSFPKASDPVYEIFEYFYKDVDYFIVNSMGRYYMVDKNLETEPELFFTDDADYSYLIFSPDTERYISRTEDGTLLVETATGETVSYSDEMLNATLLNTEVSTAPTFSKSGLATVLPFRETAVEFEERFIPVKFIDNDNVAFAVAAYESYNGYAMFDIRTERMTRYSDVGIGYEGLSGYTDFAHVFTDINDYYVYDLESGDMTTHQSDIVNYAGTITSVTQQRYVSILKWVNTDDSSAFRVKVYLLDSKTGELIDKNVEMEIPQRSNVTVVPLSDGRTVVSMSLYGDSLRYIF